MTGTQQALQALPMSITAGHGASNITCDEGAFVATIHESLLLNSDDHAGLKVYDVNVDMRNIPDCRMQQMRSQKHGHAAHLAKNTGVTASNPRFGAKKGGLRGSLCGACAWLVPESSMRCRCRLINGPDSRMWAGALCRCGLASLNHH